MANDHNEFKPKVQKRPFFGMSPRQAEEQARLDDRQYQYRDENGKLHFITREEAEKLDPKGLWG